MVNKNPRGIRVNMPSGYLLGRASAGSGRAELIKSPGLTGGSGSNSPAAIAAGVGATQLLQGADIASATEIVVGDGGYFHVTGNVTIADIDFTQDDPGRGVWLIFDGVLQLTNSSSLLLPTAANITTQAGDAIYVVNEATDVARVISYLRKDGTPLVGVTFATTTEQLTGTNTTHASTPDSVAALWEQGADVPSADPLVLGEGGFFHVTGTVTITDIDFSTDKAGRKAWVEFTGILTLTHNASTLILPTGANIVTAVGDTACFVSEGSDVIRCVSYQRKDGTALTAGATYTDEQAQDAVGAMVDTTLVYVDATPLLTRAALTGDVTAAQGSNATTIGSAKVTNAMLATMVAYSFKIRNANSTGAPTDAIYTDFTTKSIPVSGDFVVGFDSTGVIKKYDIATLPAGASSPTGNTLATEILNDTPTAYWKCDDSGSTLADSSGNGFNLTLSGTTTVNFAYLVPTDTAKYLYLAGGIGSLTSALGTSPPLTGDWTIMGIMRTEAVVTSAPFFSLGITGSEIEASNFQVGGRLNTSGTPQSYWERNAGSDVLTSAPYNNTARIDEPAMWHIIKDGTANTVTFYRNGKQLGAAVGYTTNEPTGGTGALIATIGGLATEFGAVANFSVGHVAFFNGTKLSAARIWAHARAAGLAGN